MRMISCALSVALCLSMAGCALDTGSDSQDGAMIQDDEGGTPPAGGGADQPTGNGDILPTKNGNAFLLSGYHSLFDKTTNTPCVSALDEEGVAPYTVGNVSETFQLAYVTGREELAQELGIDIGLKVRYGPIGAEGALSFVNNFSSTSRSVSFLLKATQEYTVVNRRGVSLTDEAVTRLGEGANSFTRTCGTNYINGVRHGASLLLLITYKATSEESAMSMRASLGVDASAAASPVSGDVKVRLEQAASLQGVTVTVRAATEGMFLDSDHGGVVDGLIGSSIDSNLFEEVDHIRGSMAASVQNDACRDAGAGECDGEPAPGYFANTHRNARATGVYLGFYDSLSNADWAGELNPFQQVRNRVSHVERFVRDYTEIQIRYEDIYYNEIKPFQDASAAQKAMYNIAPPGRAMRTPAEVMKVAMDLDNMFYPPKGSVVGWKMGEVIDRIQDCWDQASIDLFTSCTVGDEAYVPAGEQPPEGELEPEQTKQWNELYGLIDQYNKNSRILPVSARPGTAAVTFPEAEEHCASLESNADIQYRLATRQELELIAPYIGFGNVSWQGAFQSHATWYTPDAANACPVATPFPLYVNEPQEAVSDMRCIQEVDASWWEFWADDEFHAVPICVPSTGPIPVLADT
jgi:hypothetical protein